jgi:hypothetical protein
VVLDTNRGLSTTLTLTRCAAIPVFKLSSISSKGVSSRRFHEDSTPRGWHMIKIPTPHREEKIKLLGRRAARWRRLGRRSMW